VQAFEQLKKIIFAIHPLNDDEWNDFALIGNYLRQKEKLCLQRPVKQKGIYILL
jgi:hypothetical protein